MFIKKNIIIYILILVVGIFLAYFLNIKYKDYQTLLASQNIGITSSDKWKVTNLANNKLTAKLNSSQLKIKIVENISKEKADEYIQQRGIMLETLFDPKLPPYPGFLTKETNCQDKFKPRKKKIDNGEYYLLYAGRRFGYGICEDDIVEYKASYGFIYCEKIKKLFNIEIFTNKQDDFNEVSSLQESIYCS